MLAPPPGSPPASVLFGQRVFSLCRALGGTWQPSQSGQFSQWLWGPVTGSGSGWTWRPMTPTCSSLLKGLQSQMGHPHPRLQQAFLTQHRAWCSPGARGSPQGKAVGGLACGSDCPLTPAPSSSLKVAPCLTGARACPPPL